MNYEEEIKILAIPVIGKWVKIGEVYKSGGVFKSMYKKYAVFERINDDGMRDYKEVYMASDDSQQPVLKAQVFELK